MPKKKFTITDKIDAITLVPSDAKAFAAPPHSLKIELDTVCNLKCDFCATGSNLRKKSVMPMDTYKRIIKEAYDYNNKMDVANFYLNEPFLFGDRLVQSIKYCTDVGIKYNFLTTNGTLATKDKVKACMDAGLHSLKFSLNNATREQFATVTATSPKNFDKMLKNMEDAYNVREQGNYDCGLFASSIRYDGEQLVLMQTLINTILPFIDQHYWLPLYSQAFLLGPNEEFVAGNPGRLDNLRPSQPCFAVFAAHVKADGMMNACCFGHDEKFDMADLNKVSFADGWNSQKFQDLRQKHLDKNLVGSACEACVLYNN